MLNNSGQVAQLLRIFDQAYKGASWHGTSLRGAVRGLSAARANWRPGVGRHSIHELVVHAAYWKYAVANRLAGGRRGAFELKGSNWFARAAGEGQWSDDVALMDRVHRELRAVIASLGDADLNRPLTGRKTTPFVLISGIAAHDLYHAGQVQIIKALQRSAARPQRATRRRHAPSA